MMSLNSLKLFFASVACQRRCSRSSTGSSNVFCNELGDVAVPACSFVWYGVRDDALELVAPYNQAFHDFACSSCCLKASFSFIIFWKMQLFPLLRPARSDVPIVHSDAWNGMVTALMPSPLFSECASTDALRAP